MEKRAQGGKKKIPKGGKSKIANNSFEEEKWRLAGVYMTTQKPL